MTLVLFLKKVTDFVNFFSESIIKKIVLTKEDFSDLTIAELLQSLWCYTDTIHESGKGSAGFIFDYNCYCEELIFEKWRYHELPRCRFILNKVKEQKSLYNPGAPADSERYLEFLHGLENIDETNLDKQLYFN